MLLEVSNLAIAYGDRPIVEGVSLNLDKGQVCAIVGESGSGKTTVIRAILGCLPGLGHVTGGTMFFDGKDLSKNTPEDWRKLSGMGMSMVFQDCGGTMDPIQRIRTQFVEYIQQHSDMTEEQAVERAIQMLKRMSLPNPEVILNSYPFELSGGMNQRVGVAMAMCFSPKLLLADEPTSALDVTTQAQVVKEMMNICHEDDTAIIIVTHNLGVAAYMSDQLVVMKNGVIEDMGDRDYMLNGNHSAYTQMLLDAVPSLGGVRYV